MSMKMEIEVPEEVREEIYNTAREDLEDEIKENIIKDYLRNSDDISTISLIRDTFDIERRYEYIRHKPLKELNKNERFIVLLYFLTHEKFE